MANETTRAAEAPLRFDGSGSGGAAGAGDAPGTVSCSKCGTAIGAYYYEAGGAVFCARCKGAVEASAGSGAGGFGRAALFGAGAALLGAIGYFFFIALSGWDLALVSIAVGAFVATAMRKGSRGVGGRRYQVLAVVLTYLAVGVAHLPGVLATLNEAKSARQASVEQGPDSAQSGPGDSTVASAGELGGTAPEGDGGSSGEQVFYVAVGVVALAAAGPFIELKHGETGSSLINLIIIVVALMQAWRMTGADAATAGRVVFTGPYRVSDRQRPVAGSGG